MGKPFVLVFIPAWLFAMIWIILRPRFTQKLQDRHPGTYESLGCPPIGYQSRYNTAEISAMMAEIGFILKGGFNQLDDDQLCRLGNWLRLILITALFLMILVLGFVLRDMSSTSC